MRTATVLALVLLLLPLESAASPPVTPLGLTRRAIDTLRAVALTDPHLQQRLDRSVELLATSLPDAEGNVFLDEWRLAPPPHGRKFFDGQRDVALLLEALKRGGTPSPQAPQIEGALGDLLEADRLIATLSLETATRLVALESMRDGSVIAARAAWLDAANQTNPLKVLHQYGVAWMRSQEVAGGLSMTTVGAAPDPFSPGALAHVLTTTVSVSGPPKNHGGHPPLILELVEIVQDDSGAVVRRLTTQEELDDVPPVDGAAIASVWNGRDDRGGQVADGRYSWLAFARLRSSSGKGPWASAFPVTGTVLVVTDGDDDGVPSSVEDDAPNGGDGNLDGVPDSAQVHVVSLPNAADGRYVTLAFAPGTAPTLVAAVPNPSPADAPADARFPLGFFDFRIRGVMPGGSSVVMMRLPAGVALSTYYRFGPTPENPTPHWYEFLFDGVTGAELLADEIRLHFVDGARGDDDLTANGEIADPGAPASGPCSTAAEVQLSLAPGQSFACQLPVLGDSGTHTWAVTSTAGGSPSVLPPGLSFVEDNGRWSIAGTVAADAYLITSRSAFLGRGVALGFPFEGVTEMVFNVEIPIRVWTQNTILRPEHLIDPLEDIPHNSIAALVAAFIFGLPGGLTAEALVLADLRYHSEVANTRIDNAQRASTIISRLAAFDLIALQEAFDDEDLEHIIDDADSHFVLPGPGSEGLSILPPALPKGGSGLAALIRRGVSPLVRQFTDAMQHQGIRFTDCNRMLDDCLANKGFTFDVFHFGPDPRHYVYVVNTHAQSTVPEDREEDARVRQLQFAQIRAFIDEHADPLHPVLIMGDLNVDSANTGEWEDMLDTLGIDPANDLFGRLQPGVFTYDSDRSAYARGWFPWSQERLDYMLVRQGTRYRLDAKSVTLADEATSTSLCETSHWLHDPDAPNLRCYLSDHFGIHARLTLAEDLPLVHLLQPAEGAILLQHAPAQLQAFAGNPLRPRWDLSPRFSWTSDVDGSIGSRSARIWLPRTAGPHTLTASVTDDDGFASSASVTVVVLPDTDRDGLGDADEIARGTDPQNADSDGDRLSDGDEVLRYGSDPRNGDTDGDGLGDGDEVRAGSSPLAADSDRDGLTDATEVVEGTSPASPDSDGDDVWDGVEVILRSNPLSASVRPTAIPEGTLFTQTLGFLAVVDPARQLVGHVGTPGGGLGFGLEFDDQRRLFISAFDGLLIADPLTGATTPIGPFRTAAGEDVAVINLSFDRLGQQLYGVEEGPAPEFSPDRTARPDRSRHGHGDSHRTIGGSPLRDRLR